MISIAVGLALLVAAAHAQNVPAPVPAGPGSLNINDSAPAGGWFSVVEGKVDQVLAGAQDLCSNPYVSGPYIDEIFCGNLIPAQYTAKLGISFGANTTWCAALACAYRAMGCAQPTYRVEADIVKATGAAEPDCSTEVGLPAADCNEFAKFVAKDPNAPPAMKRAIDEETKLFTPAAFKQVEELTEEEKREATLLAATVVRAYYPDQHFEGLDELITTTKRQSGGFNALLNNLQVCSPLISLGLGIVAMSVTLPVNISGIFGPCGIACNVALCGLNLLCAKEAAPLLTSISNMRGACEPLTCASFEIAPPNVCANLTCPHPDSYFNSATCPPPQVIKVASKSTVNDCCTTCNNPCASVNCPVVQSCPAPQLPLCSVIVKAKNDPFDCCQQCIDPCYGKTCPPAPTSCPNGNIVGPSHPGDCCLSCQPKCAGIDCTGTPRQASDCPAGKMFVPPKNGANDTLTACSDCCGQCVAGASTPVVVGIRGSAATNAIGVVALVVALLSLLV